MNAPQSSTEVSLGALVYGFGSIAVVAGPIASALLFVAELSPTVSLSCGLVIGLTFRWRAIASAYAEDAAVLRTINALSAADHDSHFLEDITLTDATRVIAVDDLEDIGPGVVLDAGDAEVLFICGQELSPMVEEARFRTSVHVVRTPHAKQVLLVEFFGNECDISGSISVADLPIGIIDQCALIPRAAVCPRAPG